MNFLDPVDYEAGTNCLDFDIHNPGEDCTGYYWFPCVHSYCST